MAMITQHRLLVGQISINNILQTYEKNSIQNGQTTWNPNFTKRIKEKRISVLGWKKKTNYSYLSPSQKFNKTTEEDESRYST